MGKEVVDPEPSTHEKSQTESEDEEEQQFDELSSHRQSFWVKDIKDPIYFDRSGTTWKADPIFHERSICEYFIPEASAICVATQVEGPNPGMKAILKIRQQIPASDPDDLEPQEDVSWDKPHEKVGECALEEVKNILALTEAGCTCTPKFLDIILEKQSKYDPVPDGFRLYILMEKVPGRNLLNFGKLPLAERDQVRIAFAKAIYELHTHGHGHMDPHLRNLMWDRRNKRVYIVDMEAAGEYAIMPRIDIIFYTWGLAGTVWWDDHIVDPMVPKMGCKRPWPSEEELVQMAADAAEEQPMCPK
ncbi:hypothetical protein FQN50_002275 [Emmonsiellopsis sp. PD_5]|nr:hypothetical protein FQN50_002275 [Emmonsiellopsis sp. PD_5]